MTTGEPMTTTAGQTKRHTRRKRMVRKQVYIRPRQDEQLKRLAQQRGASEAELIREVIEILIKQQPASQEGKALPRDEAAWQVILESMQKRHGDKPLGQPHRWTREDYYDGVCDHTLAYYDAQVWAVAKLPQIPAIFSEDFNSGASLEGVRFVNPFAPAFRLDDWV
jgi:hypothetical protein